MELLSIAILCICIILFLFLFYKNFHTNYLFSSKKATQEEFTFIFSQFIIYSICLFTIILVLLDINSTNNNRQFLYIKETFGICHILLINIIILIIFPFLFIKHFKEESNNDDIRGYFFYLFYLFIITILNIINMIVYNTKGDIDVIEQSSFMKGLLHLSNIDNLLYYEVYFNFSLILLIGKCLLTFFLPYSLFQLIISSDSSNNDYKSNYYCDDEEKEKLLSNSSEKEESKCSNSSKSIEGDLEDIKSNKSDHSNCSYITPNNQNLSSSSEQQTIKNLIIKIPNIRTKNIKYLSTSSLFQTTTELAQIKYILSLLVNPFTIIFIIFISIILINTTLNDILSQVYTKSKLPLPINLPTRNFIPFIPKIFELDQLLFIIFNYSLSFFIYSIVLFFIISSFLSLSNSILEKVNSQLIISLLVKYILLLVIIGFIFETNILAPSFVSFGYLNSNQCNFSTINDPLCGISYLGLIQIKLLINFKMFFGSKLQTIFFEVLVLIGFIGNILYIIYNKIIKMRIIAKNNINLIEI